MQLQHIVLRFSLLFMTFNLIVFLNKKITFIFVRFALRGYELIQAGVFDIFCGSSLCVTR